MGALTYQPQYDLCAEPELDNLDVLARQCQKILNTEFSDKLDELYRLGGTSGGARLFWNWILSSQALITTV